MSSLPQPIKTIDAKNRYNGDKLANGNPVQAYTCEKGDNYNQNWKVI